MNDSRELTLQERSTKRANYCLMLTVLIISIYMMFLFIGTILQGNHALFRLFVIAGMIASLQLLVHCSIFLIQFPYATAMSRLHAF